MKNNSSPTVVLRKLLYVAVVLGGLWGSGDVLGQKIIYVDSAATAGGDGLSWATAFNTLDPALDTLLYDPGDQVWVAKGTYYPDSLYTAVGPNPRNRTFVLRSGLKIFGGFIAGTTSLDQRDFLNNKTILSGDIGVLGDTTDNSFSVVYAWFTDSTAWLDGFTVTKGRATDGTPLGYVNGGGINCFDQTSTTGATIRNCIITDNLATSNGGGAYIWQNNVSFYNCTFSNNRANEGAAVFTGNQSSGTFRNCIFAENIASSFGGGVAISGANNSFINSLFILNKSVNNGGAVYVDMGGAPYFANTTVQGNTATNDGGGFYIVNLAQVAINNTLLTGNFAENQGGGLYTQDVGTQVYVLNSTVSGNYADDLGGGIRQSSASVFIRNSIVYGNEHAANASLFQMQTSGLFFLINHSLIQALRNPSSGNLDADPLFLAPLSTALAPVVGGDYRVSKYSPVINAGTNVNLSTDSLDIDEDMDFLEMMPVDYQNSTRIENDTVDMGAYETLDICRPLGNSRLLFSQDSLAFCEGDSILITTRLGFSGYAWSANGQPISVPLSGFVGDTSALVHIELSDTTGCSALDSLNITEVPLPQPNIIASSNPLCTGDFVTLSTANNYAEFTWSNSAKTSFVTVAQGGTFWLDVVDSSGCANSDTFQLNEVPKPSLVISPADSIDLCTGDSVLLKALGNFVDYQWDSGETTDSIWVKTCGVFSVAAINADGCIVFDTVWVTLLPTPVVSIAADGPLTFCDQDSVVLDAGLHSKYLWSSGDTTQKVTVKSSGTVRVEVTNVEGCSVRDSVDIKVHSLPNATIFFANDTVFCQGDSILLSVNNNYSRYAWSNGDTSFATIIKTTGLVTVQVTDSNSCSNEGQINTLASPLPQPQIQAAGGSTSFCEGGSVLLGLGSGDFATVRWENHSTGTRTFANTGGYFTVDVTDSLGCAGSDSIFITVFPLPIPTITPGGIVELCQGDTVTLDVGPFADYTWFHNNAIIATSQSIETDSAGNYSVRVTDNNNCTGTDLVRVDVNPKPVISQIDTSGPTTFCDGDSVTLDPGNFTAYRWSTGETSRTITVKKSGLYTVVVFNSFNCVDSASIVVTVNPNPVASINPLGSTTICFGDSLRLDGGVHDSYRWSTGETSPIIWVKTGSQFWLEVANTFGCKASDTISTVLGPVLNPQISLSGSPTLCMGDSVTLNAGVFPAYRWSTGDTTQSITTSLGGQFWVEVSVPIGCSGADTVDINLVNNPTVSILPLGSTTFCDEDSVVLDADAFASYSWSTGDSSRFLSVDTTGTFTVTVTDNNNCKATDSISATVLPKPTAIIAPLSSTTICQGDSVSLDGGIHTSYLWSTGDTSSIITVDSTARYLLTVTNTDNCSDTASIPINVLTNPKPNIIAANTTIFCEGDSVDLDAGVYARTTWFKDGALFDSTRFIVAKEDAEYSLVVVDSSGCTGGDTIFIVVNPLPQPDILTLSHIDGNFCDGEQLTLSIGAFQAISWSTGEASRVITLDSSQLVTVVVTDGNNCTGFDSLSITEHPIPQPNIQALPDSIICQGDTATLDAGVFNFYRWNDSPTDTLLFIEVDTTGNYFVRVLNDFCLGYDTIFIQVNQNPALSLSPDTLTEICENVPINIASSNTHDSYAWSTGDTLQSIIVDSSAVYVLTVTESTGCTATDSVEIIAFSEPVVTIQANGPISFCDGDSVQLFVFSGASGYTWSNGETDTSITISVGGWYWVDVVDANGCIGRDSILVTVNPLPIVNISPPGPTSICLGTSIVLDAGAQPAGSIYDWSTNAATRTITVNSTNQYSVEVTSPQGCKTSDTTFVIASQTIFPTITSSQPLPICQGQSVVLDAGPYQSYLWTPGLTTGRTITVNQPGTYSVQVTDASGCRGDDQITVTIAQPPSPSIAALSDTIFCDGDSVVLDGGNFPFHFWNTTDISRQITAKSTGDYSVTVVDNNNCSAADTITVFVKPAPQINLTANPPVAVCEGDSVLLNANGAQPQYSYTWNTTATTEQIWTFQTGLYTVTAVDTNLCTTTDSLSITLYPLPPLNIIPSGPLSFCDGDSVSLDAGSFARYQWSRGDTTSNITVDQSGVFVVTVTDTNSCEKTDSVQVDVFALPQVNIGPSDTLIGCVGDTLIADGGVLPNYDWSSGHGGRFVEITTGGWYFLESSNADGCRAKDSVFAIFNPLPVPQIQAPDTCICSGGMMILEANPGMASYLWSTGDTLSQIQIDTSGIFSVLIVNQNGCQNTESITIAPKPLLPVQIVAVNDTVICQGDTAFLTTDTTFASYAWSTGDTSRNTNVTTSGWVEIAVRDTEGCLGIDSIFIQVNAKPIVSITPGGATTFCDGDSVQLLASPGFVSYQWSNGDTTFATFARTNGPISVSVEDNNGFRDTASLGITVFPLPVPGITNNGPTSLCFGDQVTLLGDTGYVSYAWLVNGSVISNNTSITVDSGALYTLRVEDQNGCVGTNAIRVTVGSQLSPQINGDSLLCPGQQANLFVGSFSRYAWKEVGSNDTISQTSSVIVQKTGSYWIEVRDNLGCSGRDTFDVFFAPPINLAITANGSTTLCVGDSVELSTNSVFAKYNWGTGDTTRSIWVKPSMTRAYIVTVTDQYGCTADTFRSVIVNPRPSLNILTNLAPPYCDGDSLTLFAGSFPTVSWTRKSDGALLSRDTILTIASEDIYHVAVSTAQGCTEEDSIFIQFNQNPTPTILSSGKDSLLCVGDSITLSVGQYDTYSWTGGFSDSTIGVTMPGKYIVEVTDMNGCRGRDSMQVTQVSLPVPLLQDTVVTCEDRSVLLNPGAFTQNAWSTGDTIQTLLVDTAGVYIVTVTDSNSCVAVDSTRVIELPIPNVMVTASTGTTIACSADSMTLDAGAGYAGYNWLGSGDTTRFIRPMLTGQYLVAVTDSNGCEGLGSISVVIFQSPSASFTGLDSTYCENGSRDTLIGSPAGGVFRGPGIVNSGGLTFFVPALASTGTVNVIEYIYTDPTNGCPDTARQTVTVIPVNATPIITGVADSVCANDLPFTLQAINQNNGQPIAGGNFSGPGVTGPNSQGQWIFDPTSVSPGQSYLIDYSFNAGFGCAANAQKVVFVKQIPTIHILALEDTLCANGATVTFFGDAPGAAVFSGLGVFGIDDTSAFFRPSTLGAGVYTANYIHPNQGCVSRTSQQVTIVSPVQPVLNYMDSTFCSNEPDFVFTASPSGGIFRITSPGCGSISGGNIFSPSLVPAPCFGQPINVVYEVTDANGCITDIRDTVKVFQAPSASLSGLDPVYCIDGAVDTLQASPVGGIFSGPGASSVGNAMTFTPPLAGAGTHRLVFYFEDSLGCADSVVQSVQIDPPAIISFDPMDSAFCHNEAADTLKALPGGGVFTGLGVDSMTNVFDPSLVLAGDSVAIQYRYTNPITGCVDIGRNWIIVDTVPEGSIDTLLDFLHCRERDPIVLKSTPVAPPGVFAGRTIQTPNFFDPDSRTANFSGRDTIVFSYTDSKGCMGADTTVVEIIPRDSVFIQDFPPDTVASFCYSSPVQSFIGQPAGGTFVTEMGDTLINGQLLPSDLPPDSVVYLYYIYDDGIGCLDSAFTQLRVRSSLNPEIVQFDSVYCRNSVEIPIQGLPAGGVRSASDPDVIIDGSFYPSLVSRDSSQVTLYYTVTNSAGCEETVQKEITLRDTVSSRIVEDGGGYCEGSEPVQLRGLPSGGWFIGEAITDSSGVFNPDSAMSGPNIVYYEVDDPIGCRSRTKATIFIKPQPILSVFPEDGAPFTCVDRFIGFTAEANDEFGNPLTDSVQFTWDYENGQTSQGVTGSTFYEEQGLYDVRLHADFTGCTSDTVLTVFVYPNPEPAFIGDTAVYLGDTAIFINQTPDADRYRWEFGDSLFATSVDAKHRYNSLDTFEVVLTAIKEYTALPNPEEGCSAKTRGQLVVTRRPRSEFELTVFPNPTAGILYVNLELQEADDVVLLLYDERGREVDRALFPGRPAGFQRLTFETEGLTEGVYILAIIAGEDLIELGGYRPGVVRPFGLRYNNRRKIWIQR